MSTIAIDDRRITWTLTPREAALIRDALEADLDAAYDRGGPARHHRGHLARLTTELDQAVADVRQKREA